MTTHLESRQDYFPGGTHKESVADGQTGETLSISNIPVGKSITVTLMTGANTGKIQYTTSPDDEVEADTASWHDWETGNLVGTKTSVFASMITGLRCVSVSGAVTWEVVV